MFIQQDDLLSDVSLTYGAIFLALCLGAHLILRFTLPDADPYLFPLVAILASFGLVMIYRIDEDLAREQAQWFVLGLVLFAATIVFLRDYRVLERYRYTIALAGHPAAAAAARARDRRAGQRRVPRRASSGRSPSSPPSSRRSRSSSSWPATCATRARCSMQRKPAAAQAPRPAAGRVGRGDGAARLHPRPRLVADVLRRLPRAALRRDEPAVVRGHRARHVRRRRVRSSRSTVGHVQDRVDAWQDPFDATSSTSRSAAATSSRSRCSPRPTAACSAPGFGQALLNLPGGGRDPARRRDRPDLRADHERARAVRRRGADRRLPADRRARLQDRDARPGLVLQAARHRADRGASRCRCS